MSGSSVRPYLKRLAIVFALSLGFVILFNEISFIMQKEKTRRCRAAWRGDRNCD